MRHGKQQAGQRTGQAWDMGFLQVVQVLGAPVSFHKALIRTSVFGSVSRASVEHGEGRVMWTGGSCDKTQVGPEGGTGVRKA